LCRGQAHPSGHGCVEFRAKLLGHTAQEHPAGWAWEVDKALTEASKKGKEVRATARGRCERESCEDTRLATRGIISLSSFLAWVI
jgi:hypothetical protein